MNSEHYPLNFESGTFLQSVIFSDVRYQHVLRHVILRIKDLNFGQKFKKMRLYLLISTVFSFALPRSARSVAKNRLGSRFLLTYGLENSRKKIIIPSIQEQYRKFLSRKSIRCRAGAKNKFCKMLSTK